MYMHLCKRYDKFSLVGRPTRTPPVKGMKYDKDYGTASNIGSKNLPSAFESLVDSTANSSLKLHRLLMSFYMSVH